jgi:DNA (cytosine-5)-methyltransferase 1
VKPRLLDLFCGAGGAAVGYARAGFEVVGVDIKPQPRYPFTFFQGDALEYLRGEMEEAWFAHGPFDAIHASPPCQAYVRSGMVAKDGRHPDLLGPTRDLLDETGLPWVIENVPGAPMRPDIVLCGSQFGLSVRRHRWFETNWSGPVMTLACDHSQPIAGVYGHPHGKGGPWRNGKRPMLDGNLEQWSESMGIDWMTAPELANAIPPHYTECIGIQLLAHLEATVAA